MPSTDELRVTCPVGPDALDAVHDLVARTWSSHPDVASDVREHLTTALAEIAANVVEHATSAATMTVAITVRPDAVLAEVWDDGDELPPTVVEDATWPDDPLATSGRGIPLARDATEPLVYRRDGGRNHWSMTRRR
jgi:serine/threonine-protein kinase RsbW